MKVVKVRRKITRKRLLDESTAAETVALIGDVIPEAFAGDAHAYLVGPSWRRACGCWDAPFGGRQSYVLVGPRVLSTLSTFRKVDRVSRAAHTRPGERTSGDLVYFVYLYPYALRTRKSAGLM